MTESNLTKELDAALLAYAVLKRLGVGDLVTFESRLKAQKLQYLAQQCGVSPTYSFNLYLHGPYSPTLTADLFELKRSGVLPDKTDFLPDKLKEQFAILQQTLRGLSARTLEVTATLHWFWRTAQLTEEKAQRMTADYKKATEQELNTAFALLKKLQI